MVRTVYMGIRHLDSTTGELYELPQLLNVIFGNTSIKAGIRVVDLQLCDSLQAHSALLLSGPPCLTRLG